MKIIFFAEFIADGFGGTEAVARDLANHFSIYNDVAIGYIDRPINNHFKYNNNIQHIILTEDKKLFLNHILAFDPDVFVLFGYSRNILNYIKLLHGHGIPIVCHEGAFPERVISKNWMNDDINRANALWERDLAYSDAFKIRFIFDEYRNSLSSFNYFKSISFLNPLRLYKIVEPEHKKNIIINIGGCKPNKNIFPLLKAFRNVITTYPDWELHIYSKQQKQSKYYKEIISFLTYNNLLKSVILHKPTVLIHEKYDESAFHVITSESESLSLAVAESMCHGIPSIGFAHCPGVNRLIKNEKNGILVKGGDNEIENLEKAITLLIKNKDLRLKLGHQAFDDASSFNPEKIYNMWEHIFDEALQYKKTNLLTEKHLQNDREVALHYLRIKQNIFNS